MTAITIDIRPASIKDATQIADVHASAWQQTYEGIIPHKPLRNMIARRDPDWWSRAIKRGTSVLVVDTGGMVAGYCTYGLNRAKALPQEGEIYELYVRPEYQGVGMGTRLFMGARASLVNHGCKGLVVWALEDNITAANFYFGHGGRDIAQGYETFEAKPLRKIAFVWK